MTALRISLAFLGSLLVIYPGIRIFWEFLSWAVMSALQQRPPFVSWVDGGREDPRINWRSEAFFVSLGATMIFAAFILR